jgi:hypothetical protein
MSVSEKADSDPNLKRIEAETADEIDQILGEVERLRQELNGEGDAIPPAKQSAAAPAAVTASAVETPRAAVLAAVPQPEATELDDDDLLSDFRSVAGSEAPALEDTLAELPESSLGANSTFFGEAEEDAKFEESEDDIPRIGTKVNSSVEDLMAMTPSMDTVRDFTETGASSQPASISITLSGTMTLKLKYEYQGQEITVGFSDHFLKIALADGTEFKLPVGPRADLNRKKVA